MYKIGKEFDFCYGHRVWSQELIEGYSEDMCLACRHLHGHQGKIIVYLEKIDGGDLERGMVTDFKHLGWFKKWVDNNLDHKFIMDINDPLRDKLFPITQFNKGDNEKFDKLFEVNIENNFYTLWRDVYSNLSKPEIEIYEGLIFVEFIPTSENISKWLCDVVNNKMNKIGIKCTQIQFFETPKSQSNYYE